jgi:hypothetical protein
MLISVTGSTGCATYGGKQHGNTLYRLRRPIDRFIRNVVSRHNINGRLTKRNQDMETENISDILTDILEYSGAGYDPNCRELFQTIRELEQRAKYFVLLKNNPNPSNDN